MSYFVSEIQKQGTCADGNWTITTGSSFPAIITFIARVTKKIQCSPLVPGDRYIPRHPVDPGNCRGCRAIQRELGHFKGRNGYVCYSFILLWYFYILWAIPLLLLARALKSSSGKMLPSEHCAATSQANVSSFRSGVKILPELASHFIFSC